MGIQPLVRLRCDHPTCSAVMDAYADEGTILTSSDAESKGWVADGHRDVLCPIHADASPKRAIRLPDTSNA